MFARNSAAFAPSGLIGVSRQSEVATALWIRRVWQAIQSGVPARNRDCHRNPKGALATAHALLMGRAQTKPLLMIGNAPIDA